jgi:hypothetical protein
MELDTAPNAGRPSAQSLLQKLVDKRAALALATAQLSSAEAAQHDAYAQAMEAENSVKTIPELKAGGVIVFQGKAYMLYNGNGIWGSKTDNPSIEIREVAE